MTMPLNKRLKRWGEWCDKGETGHAQGFPSQTVLSRFTSDGGIILGTGGRSIVPIDPVAEEIESIMWKMAENHVIWAKALELKWVKDMSIEEIAYEIRQCERTVKSYLALGNAYLEGAICT